jgi:hypothetical protein
VSSCPREAPARAGAPLAPADLMPRRAPAARPGVSMFCAALLLSCPCVEISIYSTCKRISQKILRNVMKFAGLIADQDMSTINCKILKENSEEIYLQGPLGKTDVRIINSYPSKVTAAKLSAKVSPKKSKV